MKKFRKLKNGESAEELEKSINLIIKKPSVQQSGLLKI